MYDSIQDTVYTVLERGRDIAESAGRKGMELWSTAKLHMEIADLQSKLNYRYTLLGKKAAVALNGDAPAFTEEMVCLGAEINCLRREIKELRAELNDRKGTCTCDACGAKNVASAGFCNRCGSELK